MADISTLTTGSVFDARPWDKQWSAEMLEPLEPIRHSLLDLLDRHVSTRPDAPLVSYFDTTLTVAEVDGAADALAVEFVEAGAVAGDRIALVLQNMPEFVIAAVAAWRIGAVVVPVNVMYRERELEHLLVDSGATILVCLDHLYREVVEPVLARTVIETVLVTDGRHFLGTDSPTPTVLQKVLPEDVPGVQRVSAALERRRGQKPIRRPGDLALLCYTSGTTGPPKGAMVTHAGLMFSARNFVRMRDLGADDVVLAVAPLFHITGIVCTLAVSLMEAMPMVLAYRFDVGTTLALVERHRVTFTVAATTVFIAFLDDPTFHAHDISSLQKIICGGAPVPPAVVQRYRSATGVLLHNGYGLTETTSPTFGTPAGAAGAVDPDTGAMSLGIPLPGTDCRLLDATGNEVPVGCPGEIVVRGPHVVAGYWNNPEETAHAIRDGWLATGDVATMDADGWFFMVDRLKDQINAAGFKVWPREVEDVLYQHPAVREAAVVGVPHPYRGETVRAVISLRDGATATDAELTSFCRRRLAAFKCPTEVLVMGELPKTASGKILRRALRDEQPTDGSTTVPDQITDLADLLATAPSNWGRWGADDEVGALNFLTPQRVLEAMSSVRQGKVFTLGTPVGSGNDPVYPGRAQAQRYNTRDWGLYSAGKAQDNPGGSQYADDYVAMFLQGATHYDGLGHVWYDDTLYNGFAASSTVGGLDKASVLPIAERGVVGRGVLLDMARHVGVDVLEKGHEIELADLLACAAAQDVEITKGSVLIIRTGFIGSFFHRDPAEFYADYVEPGLSYSPELVEWFHDTEIATLATDTMANEITVHRSGAAFVLHAALMRNLGVTFCEILSLDELAADCAADRQYDFLYTAAPLKVARATGAPVNPMAIK